jgi:hypothetical protein
VLNLALTDEGRYNGFFRIPQVREFVSYGYLNLNDRQIDEILTVVGDGGDLAELIGDLSPRYERMGEKLVAMFQVEQDLSTSHGGQHTGKKRKQLSEHVGSGSKRKTQ